jgi:lysozyme family protein
MNENNNMGMGMEMLDMGALGGSALPGGPVTSAVGEELGGFLDFLKPKEAQASDKPVLSKGSRGAEVITLQTLLGLAPDGNFGNTTLQALQRFQAQHGLAATGKADVATWAALLGAKQYRTEEEKTTRRQQKATALTDILAQFGVGDAPPDVSKDIPEQMQMASFAEDEAGMPWGKIIGGAAVLGLAGYGLYWYSNRS